MCPRLLPRPESLEAERSPTNGCSALRGWQRWGGASCADPSPSLPDLLFAPETGEEATVPVPCAARETLELEPQAQPH
jgi:hypothetical protein